MISNGYAVIDTVLSRIPVELRNTVIDVMNQTKSTMPQKRAALLKKGLLRIAIDELEVLSDACKCTFRCLDKN